MDEKLSFEEALEKLENTVRKLRSQECSLQECLEIYEQRVKYYEFCVIFLKEAKQKIEVYRPQTDTVEDFDDTQLR